jgi:hypothetical protein
MKLLRCDISIDMSLKTCPLVILLPEKRRFAGQVFSSAFKKLSKKMQVNSPLAMGEIAQLKRHFHLTPDGWPLAALCREAEFGDAADFQWLRADPVYLQAEMHGARIMAWDNLALSGNQQVQILSALRPVFGDFGFEFSASNNGYFYLRALHGSPIPAFTAAPDLLGCDLSEHMPTERKWLAIFNECQIILHNHPLNVERARIGQVPINGLWFWAQGVLPSAIQHDFVDICSDTNDIKALAEFTKQQQGNQHNNSQLKDLRSVRDWREVEAVFNAYSECLFDFADGMQWQWKPSYSWYFWRNKSLLFN